MHVYCYNLVFPWFLSCPNSLYFLLVLLVDYYKTKFMLQHRGSSTQSSYQHIYTIIELLAYFVFPPLYAFYCMLKDWSPKGVLFSGLLASSVTYLRLKSYSTRNFFSSLQNTSIVVYLIILKGKDDILSYQGNIVIYIPFL